MESPALRMVYENTLKAFFKERELMMGLFDLVTNVVKLPIAVVVDVVKSPARASDGDDFLKDTNKVIEDILES